MDDPFFIYEMPRREMEKLGIIDDIGEMKLEKNELNALLAGRRTGLMQLRNLKTQGGFYIASLDVKMSLFRNTKGKVSFKLHPVYNVPHIPFPMEDDAAEMLISGHITHHYTDRRIYEYDVETREFLSYDPASVIVPDTVNGFVLTEDQQRDFRWGNKIRLPDGTELLHKITQEAGIMASTDALILRIDRNGHKDFLTLEEIPGIPNADGREQAGRTPAFMAEKQELKRHLENLLQASRKPAGALNEASNKLKR